MYNPEKTFPFIQFMHLLGFKFNINLLTCVKIITCNVINSGHKVALYEYHYINNS